MFLKHPAYLRTFSLRSMLNEEPLEVGEISHIAIPISRGKNETGGIGVVLESNARNTTKPPGLLSMSGVVPKGFSTTGLQPSIADAGPFIVSRTEHAGNTTLSAHSHPYATVTIVLGGGYHETIGGVTHQLPSMSVVVKPAHTLHANRVDQRGARCLLLELTADGVEAVDGVGRIFEAPRVAHLVGGGELALRTLAVLEERADETGRLALESLTMELTALIGRETGTMSAKEPAARLKRVRERLHESSTDVRLADLAKEAGCHPIHLARMFRKEYGESIGSYARRVRLTTAARAIASTARDTLSRIAIRTGYYDHSHLAHEFQTRTGMTPAEWRKLAAAS